jgi:hypothetical protein
MGLNEMSRPLCQFLCCHIVWNLDEFHWFPVLNLVALPVIVEIVQVRILFSTVIRDKLIEGRMKYFYLFTPLSIVQRLWFTIILIHQMTCCIIDILSVLITKSGRMIPISTSTQRTDTTTIDEFLYIFAVLIVLNQNLTVASRITIPMTVDTDHRMIRKFDADA